MRDSDDEKESKNPLAVVLSGGALVSGTKVVALGLGYLIQVLMARLLTESGYGEVVLTIALINVAALIATLGLNKGLMRELPKYEDDPKKARGVVRAGLLIGVISGCVVAVAAFLAAPVIAGRLFGDPSLTNLVRIAALSVPFISLRKISVALARGGRDAKPRALINQLALPSLRLAFIGILIFAGFQAAGAIAGQTLAMAVASILAFVYILRYLPSPLGTTVSMYRSVLAFSLPLVVVQGMNFLNSSVDIYMVGFFLTSASVGVYNITLQLGNLSTVVLRTFGFLLPPVLTRLDNEGRSGDMLATYQGLTKWMAVAAVPVCLVLFFMPETVIGLMFGAKYTEGALTLQILVAGKLLAILAGQNFSALVALGDNRTVSYLMFVQLSLNVAANYLLIPMFGIAGAATALVGSAIAGDILGSAFLYRQYGLYPLSRSLLTSMTAVCVLAGAAFGLTAAFGLPAWSVVVIAGLGHPVIIARLTITPRDEELLGLFEDRIGRDLTVVRRMVARLQ